MELTNTDTRQPEINPGTTPPAGRDPVGREIVPVPVLSLMPGYSPRLKGEDKEHVARLAESDEPLPSILVERRSMRVIDGMHRLLAASLRGQETIDVEFFDGSAADAFLRAVETNVRHGLPLSLADRRAAAARIIKTHPQMSDRAIGETTGLAARTVAALRRRSTEMVLQLNARVGRDGRVRPLSSAEGRLRAAALLAENPRASLREIARGAGVSPATARDVRKRLERGEPPVPDRFRSGTASAGPSAQSRAARPSPQRIAAPSAVLGKLLRDPALRNNEQGRQLLRLLHVNAVGTQQWPAAVASVPPHCVAIVVQLAQHYGEMWQSIAQELDGRARITDPWTGSWSVKADHS